MLAGERAGRELDAVASVSSNYDIAAAASHLDNAGDDMAEIATLVDSQPAISVPANSAADEFHAAAASLRSGEIQAATAHLATGSASVQAATDAVDASDVMAC